MGEEKNETEENVTANEEEDPQELQPEPDEDNMQKQMNTINKELAKKYSDHAIRQRENEKRESYIIQSIKNSSSGISVREYNEESLMTDSKTVARFSPVWKQVYMVFLSFTLYLIGRVGGEICRKLSVTALRS